MTKQDAPRLPLDWEERLFGWAYRGLKKLTAPSPTTANNTALLETSIDRLGRLAEMFAGRPLHVRPAEGHGGILDSALLLPERIEAFDRSEDNLAVFKLRVVVDAACVAAGPPRPTGERFVAQVRWVAHVHQTLPGLFDDFAGLEAEWNRLAPRLASVYARGDAGLSERQRLLHNMIHHVMCAPRATFPNVAAVLATAKSASATGAAAPPCPLFGDVLVGSDLAHAETIIADAAEGESALGNVTTEVDAGPKDHINLVMLDEDDEVDAMPAHTFEKVETLDDYAGNLRHADGDDELEEHADALEELNLRDVIRGGVRPDSLMRAELEGLSLIPDVEQRHPDETGLPFDEWHEHTKTYRKGFARVFPSVAVAEDRVWAGAQRTKLARPIEEAWVRLRRQRDARERTTRQDDGDEIDLTTFVDAYAERQAGCEVPRGMFIQRPRRQRDVETCVLLDVSLSSDSYVDNRRILDVSREAIYVLGEVCARLGAALSVMSFASHTRHHCRVWRVKDFDDPWTLGAARLGALRPTGYTRIGPALRYCTDVLARRPGRQKRLLLITDGRPNDYDRYEGRHGTYDVRRAMGEAKSRGVVPFALGIDPGAAAALARMSGPGASCVVRSIDHLPEALALAYARIT